MLEIDTKLKIYSKDDKKLNPDTIPEIYDKNKCCFCETDFKSTKHCSKCAKTGTFTYFAKNL